MNRQLELLPQSASSTAPHVDAVTLALLVACGITLLILASMILFFSVKYRKGSPHPRTATKRPRHGIEWLWIFGTLIVFLALFAWGAVVYFELYSPPAGSSEVTVVAKMWMWKFQHTNGIRELNELHVPIGQPILLNMTSQDVIHSFFVPAFRVKQDVLPDRYTRIWFETTKPGSYHLFCTQYCGTMHADMRGKIIAMKPEDYQRWLETQISSGSEEGSLTMASRGRQLFTRLGCISCHGDHPGVRAPNLAGLYGRKVGLSNGATVFADENYLRESILNPKAKIVQGYQDIMPSFAQLVSAEDVLDLIAYIKSMGATPTGEKP